MNIHCIEKFFTVHDFWAICACPEKPELPRNFHCIEYTFTFRSFEQLAHALKNRGCPEFTVLNIYFLLFRIFEQLALALKSRVTLEFFTVLNILFTFRIFEELALALKNRVCPEFTVLNIYFYYSGFLSNLRLPWKQSCPGIFHCIEYVFFIIQDFWGTCACPENRVCPEIFSSPGWRPTPPPTRLVRPW